MYKQYEGKPKNFKKICGKCSKPCKTPWCVTLDDPENFEDYIEGEEESLEEKVTK